MAKEFKEGYFFVKSGWSTFSFSPLLDNGEGKKKLLI
jgi:hypothetical protein